jgi:hypothetical protein
MEEVIAWINTQATNSRQATCSKKSRKYCLPVNRKTGYKYRHRANYKSLKARAHLMFTQIIRAISQRVIPALRGVV